MESSSLKPRGRQTPLQNCEGTSDWARALSSSLTALALCWIWLLDQPLGRPVSGFSLLVPKPILEILWANLGATSAISERLSLAAWHTLLGMISFARPTVGLEPHPIGMRASSVGWWMLVSTTVPSVLSLRPRVTFSERANSPHGR